MKKQIAVDTSGNRIEVFTIGQAAKYLDMTKEHIRLQLFRENVIPFYKVRGVGGTKILRIKKQDLDTFVEDQELYGKIADKIKIARSETVVMTKGINQAQLARDTRISRSYMNRIESKKARVPIKLLEKIAKVTDKPFEWFLEG